jgi:hypothetical protein
MSTPCRALQFTLPAASAALPVSISRAWSFRATSGARGAPEPLNLLRSSCTLILADPW